MFRQEKDQRVLFIAASLVLLVLTASCIKINIKNEPSLPAPGTRVVPVSNDEAFVWITPALDSRVVIAEVPCGDPPLPTCKPPAPERELLPKLLSRITSTTDCNSRYLNSSSVGPSNCKIVVIEDEIKQEVTYQMTITFKVAAKK